MKPCKNCGIEMKKDIPLCFACRAIAITNKITHNIEDKFPEKKTEKTLIILQNELLI